MSDHTNLFGYFLLLSGYIRITYRVGHDENRLYIYIFLKILKIDILKICVVVLESRIHRLKVFYFK